MHTVIEPALLADVLLLMQSDGGRDGGHATIHASQQKASWSPSYAAQPQANTHAMLPYASRWASMSRPGHQPLKNNYESGLNTGSSAMMTPSPTKKATQDLAHSKRLARKLRHIADPSHESLTKDLLDIHRRNSVVKKMKEKSIKAVHPAFEQGVHLGEHLPNVLMSVAAKIDLESYAKDYICLSKEHKRMEKYRVYPTKRGAHHPVCVHCSRRGVQKVFFPCEHGVCSICSADQKAAKQCPLCSGIIRLILDHTGDEHEEYWKWVEAVKLSISTSFITSFFVRSKEAIRSAMADQDDVSSFSCRGEDPESESEATSFSCWRFFLRRRA